MIENQMRVWVADCPFNNCDGKVVWGYQPPLSRQTAKCSVCKSTINAKFDFIDNKISLTLVKQAVEEGSKNYHVKWRYLDDDNTTHSLECNIKAADIRDCVRILFYSINKDIDIVSLDIREFV
jgi:hypothetical protein